MRKLINGKYLFELILAMIPEGRDKYSSKIWENWGDNGKFKNPKSTLKPIDSILPLMP